MLVGIYCAPCDKGDLFVGVYLLIQSQLVTLERFIGGLNFTHSGAGYWRVPADFKWHLSSVL
jgi:hypothetical protein